jgi:hypothetical protein
MSGYGGFLRLHRGASSRPQLVILGLGRLESSSTSDDGEPSRSVMGMFDFLMSIGMRREIVGDGRAFRRCLVYLVSSGLPARDPPIQKGSAF